MFKSEFTNLIANLILSAILVFSLSYKTGITSSIMILILFIFSLRAVYDIVRYNKTKNQNS